MRRQNFERFVLGGADAGTVREFLQKRLDDLRTLKSLERDPKTDRVFFVSLMCDAGEVTGRVPWDGKARWITFRKLKAFPAGVVDLMGVYGSPGGHDLIRLGLLKPEPPEIGPGDTITLDMLNMLGKF